MRVGWPWGCPVCTELSSPVMNRSSDLPKSDPGQWWASFFFGKTTHPAMTTVSESQER